MNNNDDLLFLLRLPRLLLLLLLLLLVSSSSFRLVIWLKRFSISSSLQSLYLLLYRFNVIFRSNHRPFIRFQESSCPVPVWCVRVRVYDEVFVGLSVCVFAFRFVVVVVWRDCVILLQRKKFSNFRWYSSTLEHTTTTTTLYYDDVPIHLFVLSWILSSFSTLTIVTLIM